MKVYNIRCIRKDRIYLNYIIGILNRIYQDDRNYGFALDYTMLDGFLRFFNGYSMYLVVAYLGTELDIYYLSLVLTLVDLNKYLPTESID